MKTARHIIPLLVCLLVLPLHAHSVDNEQMKRYADKYAADKDAHSRLRLANEFFDYLSRTNYIDEPVSFPANSHIDSVDVNVYYYVAEWYYGTSDYQSAIDYCTRATKCMGVVDDASKSDVYALLGAAYFRISAFDKAVSALNRCYEIDKKGGDFDRMSSTLNSIASIFTAAGKPQEAEKYIQEAIAANSLTENLNRRAVLYGIASEIYQKLDDKQQSMEYAQKALGVERQLGDSTRIGVRLSQLATAQLGLSQVDDARRSLEEAIPLLLRSGNLHSWGICQNQMGDILASRDENDAAAACYLEAAMLFLKQGDMYNELHAREGLYKVMKSSSPNEAMMHLERAKLLQDSIYQQQTGEALGKYNALYFNDILQQEKERAEQHSRMVVVAVVVASVALFLLIGLAVIVSYRRHRQKVSRYEQRISTMQDQNETINRQYQNVIADSMQSSERLTDDDRRFLSQLTEVIEAAAEKGTTDIETIAHQMHINTVTLRRRLSQTLSATPQAFILQVRMQKAKSLLQNYRDMTIAEVSDRCGYSQLTNFTRAFTRYFGVNPSDVRINTKNNTSQSEVQGSKPQLSENQHFTTPIMGGVIKATKLSVAVSRRNVNKIYALYSLKAFFDILDYRKKIMCRIICVCRFFAVPLHYKKCINTQATHSAQCKYNEFNYDRRIFIAVYARAVEAHFFGFQALFIPQDGVE